MDIFSASAAAAYCGMKLPAFRHHINKTNNVESFRSGHTILFTKEALDKFMATKPPVGYPKGRPRKKREVE